MTLTEPYYPNSAYHVAHTLEMADFDDTVHELWNYDNNIELVRLSNLQYHIGILVTIDISKSNNGT